MEHKVFHSLLVLYATNREGVVLVSVELGCTIKAVVQVHEAGVVAIVRRGTPEVGAVAIVDEVTIVVP